MRSSCDLSFGVNNCEGWITPYSHRITKEEGPLEVVWPSPSLKAGSTLQLDHYVDWHEKPYARKKNLRPSEIEII